MSQLARRHFKLLKDYQHLIFFHFSQIHVLAYAFSTVLLAELSGTTSLCIKMHLDVMFWIRTSFAQDWNRGSKRTNYSKQVD